MILSFGLSSNLGHSISGTEKTKYQLYYCYTYFHEVNYSYYIIIIHALITHTQIKSIQ